MSGEQQQRASLPLTGIIDQPTVIRQEYTGTKISGMSADDIIAMLQGSDGKIACSTCKKESNRITSGKCSSCLHNE